MGRHSYREQADRRAEEDAADRIVALNAIAAICKEKELGHPHLLGIEEWQADKNAIDAIRQIVNELPE